MEALCQNVEVKRFTFSYRHVINGPSRISIGNHETVKYVERIFVSNSNSHLNVNINSITVERYQLNERRNFEVRSFSDSWKKIADTFFVLGVKTLGNRNNDFPFDQQTMKWQIWLDMPIGISENTCVWCWIEIHFWKMREFGTLSVIELRMIVQI